MDRIKKLLTSEIISAIVDGVMFIGTLAMMYVYSPLLATSGKGSSGRPRRATGRTGPSDVDRVDSTE